MIQLVPHDLVALAGRVFQTLPVENGDLAPVVADQARLLERSGDQPQRGSARSDHHRKKFLSEGQLVGLQPGLQIVKAIADG
jgi:hypothetical protein